jgi:hypothetical protein
VNARRDDPEVAEALTLLGAVDASEESIYPYSPVFRATLDGRPVVVKRTRRSVPAAIATWVRSLAANGFPVVTPVSEPVRDSSGAARVAYPWIDGRPYQPSSHDIAAAGDLLGRLHAWCGAPSGIPTFCFAHVRLTVEERALWPVALPRRRAVRRREPISALKR